MITKEGLAELKEKAYHYVKTMKPEVELCHIKSVSISDDGMIDIIYVAKEQMNIYELITGNYWYQNYNYLKMSVTPEVLMGQKDDFKKIRQEEIKNKFNEKIRMMEEQMQKELEKIK